MTSGKPYHEDDWEDGDVVGPVTMNEHAQAHGDLDAKTTGLSEDGSEIDLESAEIDDVFADVNIVIDGQPVSISYRTIVSTLDIATIEANASELPGGEFRDGDIYIRVEED